MPSIVLIAPPEHLPTLQRRAELGESAAFADTDALKALDLILRERPSTVVIERVFAETSRGAALIKRVKADPQLRACEIRIVSHEPPARREGAEAAADVGADGAPAADAPIEQRGTRRAPRFRIVDGVEVTLDGNPARLIDLSTAGAQVVSSAALKPNQRLRVVLPDPEHPLRLNAVVAWAAFEIPKTGPRYRAGIEFADADPAAVGRLIERKKR